MDNDCGNMVSVNHTLVALRLGLITEELIDERVGNLFKIRFRLGQFDAPGPLDEITNASAGVCSERALELARDGVAQGTTLLKNTGKTLPIDAAKSGRTVAVIGPLLGDRFTSSLSSYYGPLVSCRNAPYWVGHHHTLLDGVRHYVGPNRLTMHCGTSVGFYNSTTMKMACAAPNIAYNATAIASAVKIAKAADCRTRRWQWDSDCSRRTRCN